MATSCCRRLVKLSPLLRIHHSISTPKVLPVVHCSVRHKGQRVKLPPEPKEKTARVLKKTDSELDPVKALNPKELKEFLKRVPLDDVWIRKYYPPQKYSFSDVLQMHRELAVPEMFDNSDGALFADFELDMSTKKKTKFLSAVKGTVMFPHSFDDGIQNRVVAIAKSSEDQEAALKMGAVYSGGLNIIRLIERGEIRPDDYTHLVCHVDMLTEITVIKKHLKQHFPTRKNGNLGVNIAELVNLYVKGRSFESKKVADSLSTLNIIFGRLNMSDQQLRENLQTLVDYASSLKSPSLSKLISKISVRCPPSKEVFIVHDSEFVPNILSTSRPDVTVTVSDDAVDDDDVNADVDDDSEQLKSKK